MAILRQTGYVQLRRGLFEHVSKGSMSPLGCFLYTAILANANPETGIWEGSSGLLAAIFDLPPRTCRDLLENLEKKQYIRRFPTRGKHGSYPIMVHQFECSSGAAKGKRLNALLSTSCANPIYEVCDEDVNDSAGVAAAKYKRLRERENIKLTLDETQQLEKVYEAYPRKVGKAAALKAIEKAVKRLGEGEAPEEPKLPEDARRYLWKKAAQYAISPIAAKPASGEEDYRPHPATWFNQARYLDDIEEWKKSRNGNGAHANGKPKPVTMDDMKFVNDEVAH